MTSVPAQVLVGNNPEPQWQADGLGQAGGTPGVDGEGDEPPAPGPTVVRMKLRFCLPGATSPGPCHVAHARAQGALWAALLRLGS